MAAELFGDADAVRRLAERREGAWVLDAGVANLKIIFNSRVIVSQSDARVNLRCHAQM